MGGASSRSGSRVENVEPILVQIDADIRPRLVGIGQLELMAGDALDVVPRVVGHLDTRLLTIPHGGIVDRRHDVDRPVPGASLICDVTQLRMYPLGIGVVDDRHRVTGAALFPLVDTPRKLRAVLGVPRDRVDLRFTRRRNGEAIDSILVLRPALRRDRLRNSTPNATIKEATRISLPSRFRSPVLV